MPLVSTIDRGLHSPVWLLCLVAVLVLAQQFLPFPDHTQLLNALLNLLHYPMFMGVAFAIWRLCPARWSMSAQVLCSALSVLLIAGVTELLQLFNSGHPSIGDLITDVIAGGLTVCALAAGSTRARRLWLLGLVLSCLVVAHPVWTALLAQRALQAEPGVLVPYERPFTRSLIRCGCEFAVETEPEVGVGRDSPSRLRLDYSADDWKGLLFVDIPRNRLQNAQIKFEFESAVALSSLRVRVRNQGERPEESSQTLPAGALSGRIVLPLAGLLAELPSAPYVDLLFHFQLDAKEKILGEVLFSRIELEPIP